MSILVIRNDDDCEEVYNRTTVFCFTKMLREELFEYVKSLELLADDRQALFFKIDVDIFAAPRSMPDLEEWSILSFVLKAHKRPFSFGILVKLFYEHFPFKLMVDFSTTNLFICSGANSEKGDSLSAADSAAYHKLSSHYMKNFVNVLEAAKIYKEKVKTPDEAPELLVKMAREYGIKGGHWIMFFKKMDPSKREDAFNKTLEAALEHWERPIGRFNAKISTDNFIICFGNQRTLAATIPALLESTTKEKYVESDPEPFELRHVIDTLYENNPTLFGFMGIKYKPDIVSACCIQRDNFIRPTVYHANYGFYNHSFHPCTSDRLAPPQSPSPRF